MGCSSNVYRRWQFPPKELNEKLIGHFWIKIFKLWQFNCQNTFYCIDCGSSQIICKYVKKGFLIQTDQLYQIGRLISIKCKKKERNKRIVQVNCEFGQLETDHFIGLLFVEVFFKH